MERLNQSFAIQGIPVEDLVATYGTPLFVYDAAIMERQYKRLVKAFKGVDLRINYACKALGNINVLRFFKSLGSGLDTVSIQEVHLGLKAGFAPESIIFTPNCVSLEEILEATALGVRINIDNLSILEQFGARMGGNYPVCVRINPHILAGGNHKISTGHIDSKFGISIHQMRHLERIIKSLGIHVNGLHMHTGSEILDPEVFVRGAEILLEAAHHFPDLEYLDFGSGFKVAYKPGEPETDVEEVGRRLVPALQEFFGTYGRKLRLEFEPGKFLVSQSGTFLCSVNVIKQTTATVFAGVNTGLNHFIRPMFYDSYHHIVNVSNPEGKQRLYTVVGYICETDTFAWDRPLEEVREGDTLAFLNAGAYLYTMSSNYNGRPRPAEVLILNGKHHLITQRETLDDLLKNQIEVKELA